MMKKRVRWLLAVMLTVAMTLSCMPVASAAGSRTAKGNRTTNPWGINVDLSNVPGQVQEAVANMIAQGMEPMEKKTDAFLAEVVEDASGISFEAVKGSLGLELLSGAEGAMDTSRFNLGEEEFNRVMKEVLSEYFLTNVAYDYEVEDGIVTGLWFMPAIDAASYRGMFTASDLWSMYRTPLTAASLSASRLANDPLPEDETEGAGTEGTGTEGTGTEGTGTEGTGTEGTGTEGTGTEGTGTEGTGTEGTGTEGEGETDPEPEPANERTVTLQVKWKDNNKKSNRPESVKVYLDDGKDSKDYYYYSFETVTDGEATIVVPYKDSEGNVIEYAIVEEGAEDGKLEGLNGATYTVTTAQDRDTYTVTNTADGKNGEEFDVAFNWVRDDQYVPATDKEIEQGASIDMSEYGIDYPVALTLVYDAEKKAIGYGPKSTIDFKLGSVTLTAKDGVTITVPVGEDGVSYSTMYEFQGTELPDKDRFGDYAAYASTIKYGTYDCDYGTFEDRKDVTASAEAIHWNQMLAFTGDFAQHFGAAGDFWTSKNTENTPYGAFKTQLDSYPEDYMPDAVMDQYMELMTLAYMSYEQSYGSLLDQKIADCLAQLDENMTPVQKYLVIHDWIANNAQFDMGVLIKTAAGTSNPDPAQMTAFGTLLSDAMGYDGCICLGYSATFAVLVQQAFPEIYQNDDGTWKTASDVGDNDIVDLVQIRFYADLADVSVAGGDSGFGKADEMFGSSHYYNAVKVTQEDGSSAWYCIDSAYDDITTEVMDQCRVETKGNISHKYFMISPVNMLDMFKNSMDYIDCLYDGVVFRRNLLQDENGNYYYETEYIEKYDEDHVVWYRSDTDDEIAYDDDQYEATWFSGAVGEIAHDDNYWYYITGPSFSYASMLALMNKIQDSGNGGSNMGDMGNMDNPFNSDEPSDKDRLVRRPRTAADEPEETEDEGGSTGGSGGMGGMGDFANMSSYDDPYDQILFHFGYGSVLPDEAVLDNEDIPEDEKQGKYYDQVVLDGTYYDMYPDLVHSMGMYDGVLYFNLGNKIYTMTGANTQGDLTAEDLTVAQLKEYNDVYAKTDGRDFTGMSFYAVSKADYENGAEDNAFHVFNRPIAAICIEDEVSYADQPVYAPDGETVVGMAKVRDTVTPTLTVSIGTNFSESYKTKDGAKYQLEAVDYNPNYSKYTDDKDDPATNDNEEFMWCANVVDTMPMDDMLKDKDSGEKKDVTIDAWCDQDGYTEQRTVGYGLSDGTGKTVNKSDLALNHHYIENEREACYICVHCNDSYHDEYTEDDDGYKPLPEGATIGHYENSKPTFVDIVWGNNYTTCTAKIQCSEPHCDHVMREIECDEIIESTVKDADGTVKPMITASYDGNVVDRQYPEGKPSVVLGDVNGDGKINSGDLLRLRKYLLDDSTEISNLATDVNGDGKINSGDLLRLRKYLLDSNNVALG